MTQSATIERQSAERAPAVGGRLAALDGLRGVAALVVVFHHAALLWPSWPGNVSTSRLLPGSAEWWLNETPLKLATAGAEAVVVFFVLSGLVVTLPVLRGRAFDWVAYFPRRVARLVLPVLGSVVLAALWIVLIPQVSPQADGTWVSSSSTPRLAWQQIVLAADVFGGDGHINNPLWTLRWELIFSLMLPAFVAVAAFAARRTALAIFGALVLVWLGVRTDTGSLHYLPAFFVGAVLAYRLDDLRRLGDRLRARRWGDFAGIGMTVAGLLLLIAWWLATPLYAALPELQWVLQTLIPLGAALLVVSAVCWRGLRAALSTRAVQHLGRISFSLYLVHAPILLFSFYALGAESILLAEVVGVLMSLAVAGAFWWGFERHTYQWARRIGVAMSAKMEAMRAIRSPQS